MTSKRCAKIATVRKSRLIPKRYRWELLPKLASEIEYGMRPQAHRDLTTLIDSFRRDSATLSVGKIRCCQTASACMRGARRGGADSGALFDEHLALLDAVSKLKSWPRLTRRLHDYVDELLEHLAPQKPSSAMAEKIRGMRESMRASLKSPRTLSQFAVQLGVSTGHLSRTFTALVGRPFRDEVRRLRNEEACGLLVHSELKLAEVAQRIGIASTSQFIADFRRELGITPAEYRRRHPKRRPKREFA